MYLVAGVARVPQCIAEDLARACLGLDGLQLDAGLSDRTEWRRVPVCLLLLLPHDHVEVGAVLVANKHGGKY